MRGQSRGLVTSVQCGAVQVTTSESEFRQEEHLHLSSDVERTTHNSGHEELFSKTSVLGVLGTLHTVRFVPYTFAWPIGQPLTMQLHTLYIHGQVIAPKMANCHYVPPIDLLHSALHTPRHNHKQISSQGAII